MSMIQVTIEDHGEVDIKGIPAIVKMMQKFDDLRGMFEGFMSDLQEMKNIQSELVQQVSACLSLLFVSVSFVCVIQCHFCCALPQCVARCFAFAVRACLASSVLIMRVVPRCRALWRCCKVNAAWVIWWESVDGMMPLKLVGLMLLWLCAVVLCGNNSVTRWCTFWLHIFFFAFTAVAAVQRRSPQRHCRCVPAPCK